MARNPERSVAVGFSRLTKSVKIAARNPLGIWKVMTMIMTMVAAMVMRATTQARPGYGASSFLRKPQNHWPAWSIAREGSAAGTVSLRNAMATATFPGRLLE
jgi:hypothetical protein